MKRLAKNMFKNEDGVISILFALSLMVLLGFAALGVDVVVLHLKQTELQNAADAGALAGAQDLDEVNDAISTAENFAVLNGAERANTTVTTPYNGNANLIEVVCTMNVENSFAKVLGITDTDVYARAVAQREMGEGDSGPVVFSGDDEDYLKLNGEDITILGDMYTNSTFEVDAEDVTVDGDIDAVGGIDVGGENNSFSSDPVTGTDVDPQFDSAVTFASSIGLDDPDSSDDLVDLVLSDPDLNTKNNGDKIITNNTNKSWNVKNGKYIIEEDDLTINGSIIASDVIEFKPGTTIGAPDNPVLVYSKFEDGDAIKLDSEDITIYGTLYAPYGTVKINDEDIKIYGRVVADVVHINAEDTIIDGSSLSGGEGNAVIHLIE